MTYVDGYVIPIKKNKVASYKRMARWGKQLWMKQGDLQYFECQGDDLTSMPGCGTFKTLAKLKPGETAFFSFVVYKNRAHRDAVNKRVMAAMQSKKMPANMPFEPKRIAFGGFKTVVQG